mgnify:CR=1 FL=1
MLFTSIYRKKINAAEALIPLVAFNFKTYPFQFITKNPEKSISEVLSEARTGFEPVIRVLQTPEKNLGTL